MVGLDKRKLNPQLLKDTPSGIPQLKRTALIIFVILESINIWFRYHYHFSTLNYKNTPTSLTAFDYCLIVLLVVAGVFYILQKSTNYYIYYKYMLYSFNLFAIELLFSGIWPSISWINYGWYFPLHDYFFPLITSNNALEGFQYIALGLYINANATFYKGLEKKGLF